MAQTKMDQLREMARKQGLLRPEDLQSTDIPESYLWRLWKRGELERVERGLYRHPDSEITPNHSLAEAVKAVGKGVICLRSALRFHGLTTQNPHQVWMTIGHKARKPATEQLHLRIVRMSGRALSEGIETHEIEKVEVPIYSAAKTVADCFKFRSDVGLDAAIEALREYHETQVGTMDELWRFAKICRVQNVMRPYMEVVV